MPGARCGEGEEPAALVAQLVAFGRRQRRERPDAQDGGVAVAVDRPRPADLAIDGVIWKAYENDGVPFPTDPDGAIEGQRLCREWGTRQVFSSDHKFSLHHQYTDTPAGTFWCTTYLEAGRAPDHAVTVGTRFADAQWFRGRVGARRSASACSDGPCCRRPDAAAAARWDGRA